MNQILIVSKGGQVVATSTAQRWADERGMPLFETSAKDDSLADNVDGIFLTVAHKLREEPALMEHQGDTCGLSTILPFFPTAIKKVNNMC